MSKKIFERASRYFYTFATRKLEENQVVKYINQELNDVPPGYYVSFVVKAERNFVNDVDCIDVCYRLESYDQYVEREGLDKKENPSEDFYFVNETYVLGSKEYVTLMESMALSLHHTKEKELFLEDIICVGEFILVEYDENEKPYISLRRPLYADDCFSDDEFDCFYDDVVQERLIGENTVSGIMNVTRNAMILNIDHKIKVDKPSPNINFYDLIPENFDNDIVPNGWYVSVALYANLYGPEYAEEGVEVIYKLEPYDLYFNKINGKEFDNFEDTSYVIKQKFAFNTEVHEEFTSAMSKVLFDDTDTSFSVFDVNNAHEVVALLHDDERHDVVFKFRRPLYFEDRLTNEKLAELSKPVRI